MGKFLDKQLDKVLKRYASLYMRNYFFTRYGLDMTEVRKILDHATSPTEKVDKNPEKEESVGDFIKENIINKQPEYPEYDKATFASTMNNLREVINDNLKELTAEPKYLAESHDISSEDIIDCLNTLGVRVPSNRDHSDLVEDLEARIRAKRYEFRDSCTGVDNKDEILEQLLMIAPRVNVFKNLHHVYIINGYARSGKDTFINLCDNNFQASPDSYIRSISSVQGIKNIAEKYFDYDEERKNDKDRKFLADMKALTTDYCDYSMKYILKQIIKADIQGCSYVFIHIREPKEIARACNEINRIIFPRFVDALEENKYNGPTFKGLLKYFFPRTIFIDRKTERVTNNSSDLNVEDYEYDYYIDNNGSIEALDLQARNFYNKEVCTPIENLIDENGDIDFKFKML